MKTEWEFQFTTKGFRFDRDYKYLAKLDEKISLDGREPELIEPLIRIVPSDREPIPDTDQIGSLFILLPYSPQETKEFAFNLAGLVAERTSFTHGDFRILGGLILYKRIPENPQEKAEFGDSPFGIEMKLIEDIPLDKFESNALQGAPIDIAWLPLIAQFNEAKRISRPILRFLEFFKIIESLTHVKNESRKLKPVLSSSTKLRRIYANLNTAMDFDSFVDRAANVRHKCAHLKLDNEFGYTPLDSSVKSEVEPLLQNLEALSQEAIKHWGETDT